MKGYKTVGFAFLLIVIGGLEQFDVTQIVPLEYEGLAKQMIGLVILLLRMATTTPMFRREGS